MSTVTTHQSGNISQRQAAIIAGTSSLVMLVAAIVAEVLVRQTLIIPNDTTATAHALLGNQTIFRIGLACFFLILLCDMLAAWSLYLVLKPVHKSLSLLAAWFRLVYTAVFAMSLQYLVTGFRFLTTAAEQSEQLHNNVMQYFTAFEDGWALSFVFFSGHLLLLGYLAYTSSGSIPKILGIGLLLASCAYLVENTAKLLLPTYEHYQALLTAGVVATSFVGEIGLALWLLFKGGKSSSYSVHKTQ